MRTTGHFISDGFRLRYIVEGAGLPALVVGSSLYYDRTFSRELRERLRMAFVDHRGFAPGNRCDDRNKYRLDVLVDDIELLRGEIGFDRMVLIGHSGHAFLALEYARKYPARVSHLVLMCSAPSFSAAAHEAAARHLAESVCPARKAALARNLATLDRDLAAAPDRAFVTYCLAMGPKTWYDPEFDAQSLWEGVEVNMAMFDYVWGEVFRDIDITHAVDRLQAPVLLALGRYDYLVPPAHLWEGLRDRFRDLTVRVFERSGHAPQFEEPGEFDRELCGWLASR